MLLNFVEAHRLFSEHRPEIIICDIHLQNDENGISIINELSIMGKFEVIYLTSYSDQKTLDKAFATKPFSYITKPFKEIDIYTNIMLCISKIKENVQRAHCSYDPETKVWR